MNRKAAWLFITCTMLLSLVLASCAAAPSTPTTPTTPTQPAPTTPATPATPPAPKPGDTNITPSAPETPKYGGVFTLATSTASGLTGFDEALVGHRIYASTMFWTHDQTGIGDWTKGPAGTGEVTWRYTIFPGQVSLKNIRFEVFESWEMPDTNTHIFKVRKGIRFHNKPPVNGRELDAYDVEFTLNRLWNIPTSRSHYQNYPFAQNLEYIKALDKWTIEVKYKPKKSGIVWEVIANHVSVQPREIAKADGTQWGTKFLTDWRNVVGSGPFLLTDYVESSVATLVRNPNYWDTDPIGPGKGNQLPYIDGIKWLIIPDASTRLAALRTGKVDWLDGITWEDMLSLKRTNPELKYLNSPAGTNTALYMRVDKEELPFKDIRVRQALMLATDQKTILEKYYGGYATMLSAPVAAIPEYKDVFIPLEQLPANVQELFGYNPDKAKQLLKEAGYPNGFKTKIMLTSTSVDLLSIVKEMWAKVGVDLTLDVKETGAFTGLLYAYNYDMVTGSIIASLPYKVQSYTKEIAYSFSRNNDPFIEESYWYMADNYWEQDKRKARMRELIPYILEKSYQVLLPYPFTYTFWQPWVKNYHGELSVAYVDYYNWQRWIWIDQDLKKKMTGK